MNRVSGGSTLHIVGAGGFGREVAWLARRALGDATPLCFVVDDPKYICHSVDGVQVRLLDEQLCGERYVIAVGAPKARLALARKCRALQMVPAALVHPRVEVSQSVDVTAGGLIVCAGSALTVDIKLGQHVHVNLNCTIGHDVEIGDFTTLSPGVHISGNVHVGSGVFFGTGAVVVNGSPGKPLVIGDGAVVAAAACVTKEVPPGVLVAGVPAVVKK